MLDCALGYAGDFLNGRGRLSDDENRDVVVDGDLCPRVPRHRALM